jgi:alpha-beta hydrolase superfamily lysophospholipase
MLRASEAPMKHCSHSSLRDCFQSPDTATHGFILSEPQTKTPFSALLLHGLGESPYYMKDVAQRLFSKGINVVAIRLSGHGTRKEHLSEVTASDWEEDVSHGMELARSLGEQVILIGFSTGGALAFHHALEAPSHLAALALLVPATHLRDIRTDLFCDSLLQSTAEQTVPWALKQHGEVAAKYDSVPTSAVCELYEITRRLDARLKAAGSDPAAREILTGIPSLLLLTGSDRLVDPFLTLDAFTSSPFGRKTLAMVTTSAELNGVWKRHLSAHEKIGIQVMRFPVSRKLDHLSLLLEGGAFAYPHQINPHFQEIYGSIELLLEQITAPAAPAGERRDAAEEETAGRGWH